MRTFPVLLSRLVAACLLAGLAAGCSKKPGAANYEESAKKFFEKGELEKAKIEYMNLLRIDKVNATAMRRLGQIWMAQGGPLRAMPYLQEAVKLAPADTALRKQLMDAWIELGGVQEARDEAVEILKTAPDTGEALIVLTESAVDEEEFTEARDYIAKFPAKDSAAIHVAEASLCLQQNNKEGAKEALAKAVAVDPKSTAAMLVAGNILLKENDVAGAEAKFKELAEASPARSLHRLRYVEYISRHQSSEAKKQASELVEQLVSEAPDYLPALTLSAQLTLARQKAREGIAILEKVFAIDNGNPPARMVQARLWMALGEPQKAIEGLEGMLLHNPENLSAKFQLALACVQNANTAKAMLVLETILKDNPGFGDALLLLAELNLRSGEPEAVVSLVASLLKERPGHPLAAYLLAGAYQALKKTDEAAKLMEEMVKANPKDPRPRFRLGEIYRSAGRIADARTVFEQALAIFPGSFPVTAQLIDLDLLEKKTNVALERVDKFIQEKPDVAGAYLIKAQIYLALKAWTEAETATLKVLEKDAANSDAFRLLASIYVQNGKLPEAASRLEALMAANPRDAGALRQAAIIYDKQGAYAKAVDANEKLLSLLPEPEPMILNDLAYVLSEHLDKTDKALEIARKARGLRPGVGTEGTVVIRSESAAIADTLGWILFRRGEYREALELVREAAGVLKDNPEIQFHLGKAAYMMGDETEAREALKIAENGDYPWRKEAQVKLSLLGNADGTAPPLSAADLSAMAAKEPGDVLLQSRLAEACEREKKYEEAAAAAEQALKLNPKLFRMTVKLVKWYAGPLHKPERAFELAKSARTMAPDDPVTAGLLGEAYYQTGRFADAYNLLQESTRVSKPDPAVLKSLAWAAYSMGKVPESRETMKLVVNTSPNTPEAAEAQSFLTLTETGDDPAALTAAGVLAEEVLKQEPGHTPALMIRAALQNQKSMAAEATAIYEGIVKRLPDFAPAQKYLAALYSGDPRKLEEGFKLASKARESLPDDIGLAQTLAILNYQRQNYSYTVQLLQECSRSKPLDAQGLFYMGMSRYQTNDKTGGREALVSALAAGLKEPLATEARRRMRDRNK